MDTLNQIKYQENQIASKLIRFVNFIIDIILITLISATISVQNNDPNNSSLLLVFIGYYILLELLFGKTIGKFITKTSVKNLYGKKLTFRIILGRTLTRLIPLEAFTLLFDGKADAWHDRFSSTIVVSDSKI